jgi:hypothetical protein
VISQGGKAKLNRTRIHGWQLAALWGLSFTPGFSQLSAKLSKFAEPFKRFPIEGLKRGHLAEGVCREKPRSGEMFIEKPADLFSSRVIEQNAPHFAQ